MTEHRRTSPTRHSHRLAGWDYSFPSAYFVTICARERRPLFGSISEAGMRLSEIGMVAQGEWLVTERLRPEVELDAFVVMPNHVHAVVWLLPPPTKDGPVPTTLGAIIGHFKAAVTKSVNALRRSPGEKVWQPDFYDHIVRSERALAAIREYIETNPLRWMLDRYNPDARGGDPMAACLWKMLEEEADRTPPRPNWRRRA